MCCIVLALCVAGAGMAQAASLQPRVSVTVSAVVLTVGDLAVVADLSNAGLRLSGPGCEYSFVPNIQAAGGWTQPGQALAPARVVQSADAVRVDITYPVAEEREFILNLSAIRQVPAVFVTSRLKVLTGPRPQYYFWQTNITAQVYAAAGLQGIEEHALDPAQWHRIDWAPWWFFPAQIEGGVGLAVLPTNCAGRSPGDTGGIFLHALPRSYVLDAGGTLDASFGLALAKDPDAAARIFSIARQWNVAALQPWTWPPPRVNYGQPAPTWLRNAEIYNLYYRPAAQWTKEIVSDRLSAFPFIIGSTPDKTALERCHAVGTRLLHYIVYTCLLDTEAQVRDGGQLYSEWLESVDHESRDLKDHPDWVCIGADGNPRHDVWGMEHGHPGLFNTCLHQAGLHEAAVRQVRMLMDLGFDGVFVDLAGPVEECFGPQFGKHTHDGAAANNNEAYGKLLAELYRTVKCFGEDRIVIHNTVVSLLPSRWPNCDAQMIEAFPYSWDSDGLRATWPEMRWTATRAASAVRSGKVVVMLPYFGAFTADKVRDPALFSYAYARVYDLLWADALTLADIPGNEDFAQALYKVRLGKPTGLPRETDGVVWRTFERGAVVLNPQPWPARCRIPVAEAGPFVSVGFGDWIVPRNGRAQLEMPAWSGRVLIGKRNDSGAG